MKRLLALLLLTASTAFAAEQATLHTNTVMRTGNSLVILKAGTVVQILARNDKTVTVKSGNKTGMIPWAALVTEEDMMSAPTNSAPISRPSPASTGPAPTPVATSAPAPTPTPTSSEPPKPKTMYGKAVQKAAATAATHDKNQVQPTDEILGGN